MQLRNIISTAVILTGLVASAPLPSLAPFLFARESSAVSMIETIMPKSTSCPSGLQGCATAEQAAPYLIQAFQTYNLQSSGQIAGVLALIGYESNDLEYRQNVDPGRPGQGTANMQMASYNLMYAQSIPALKADADAIGTSTAAMSDAQLNDVLALVTVDEYNFASGAWFLATQCSQDVRNELATGTTAGFTAYMDCVGVSATSDRTAYWTRAQEAFGLSG